jgi:hypothetical protein
MILSQVPRFSFLELVPGPFILAINYFNIIFSSFFLTIEIHVNIHFSFEIFEGDRLTNWEIFIFLTLEVLHIFIFLPS